MHGIQSRGNVDRLHAEVETHRSAKLAVSIISAGFIQVARDRFEVVLESEACVWGTGEHRVALGGD